MLTGDAAPAAAPSLQSDGRLIEVVSKHDHRPIDVASNIWTAFDDEIATVRPVPFAIPAIAPASAQSGPLITQNPDFHDLQTYGGAVPGGVGFSDLRTCGARMVPEPLSLISRADGSFATMPCIRCVATFGLAHHRLRAGGLSAEQP